MNRYKDLNPFKNPQGKRYYPGVKYPEIPYSDQDFYVIAQEGDRYDQYANTYYNDSTLWWIIAAANPRFKPNSIYPERGHQIRIPSNISSILKEYKLLNK